ncbi:sodium:solute symporter family protein [Evansella halocellulosilytica]|uniref:sodium:solute symporter family protein n=1 Tax=Evansella halocellulosilytica TaxID=2011013 RepID=UPI000BB99C7C|nr:hypothetical protein [Evansella halocellulosilytica]
MTLELFIVILYLIFCVYLGFISQKSIAKSSSGVSEYYAAGQKIGTTVNALAMLSALGSGGTFLALVGTLWGLGMSYVGWMFAGAIVGFPVASILVARALRNSQQFTVSGFLNDRFYGSKFLKIAVPLVIVVGSGMYLMSQLTAGGLLTIYVTGLSYEWSLLIISLVFILYVSMGGMLAVTWTNVLQGGTIVLIVLLIGVVGLINLPENWSQFFLGAVSENEVLGSHGTISANLGVFITWAAAVCVAPHLIMRVFTASNVRSAKLSMNISMFIYATLLLVPFLIMIPYIPTLGEETLASHASDMWLLLIVEQFFGPIIMGIIIAGLLAAVMSSTDALLLATSSAVAYDLYNKVLNPDASREKILKVSMISTWIIGIIVMLLALNPPPFLIVLYTAAIGFMVCAFLAPMLLGIWWKKANTNGAIAGLTTGALTYLISFFFFDMTSNTEILIALPISFASMIVVSLLTKDSTVEGIAENKNYHRNIEEVS